MTRHVFSVIYHNSPQFIHIRKNTIKYCRYKRVSLNEVKVFYSQQLKMKRATEM